MLALVPTYLGVHADASVRVSLGLDTMPELVGGEMPWARRTFPLHELHEHLSNWAQSKNSTPFRKSAKDLESAVLRK